MEKKKTNKWLFVIPILMFGFGYLMVPLYSVFCDVTGLNGKTGQAEANIELKEDDSRLVKVEFTSTLNQEAPWEFKPDQKSIMVHPGKPYTVTFTAQNKTGKHKVAQAIPSLAPSIAAEYFKKIECFCFNNQSFKAEESRHMPVTFFVDPKLPGEIHTVTLSYTFFDVTKMAKN